MKTLLLLIAAAAIVLIILSRIGAVEKRLHCISFS